MPAAWFCCSRSRRSPAKSPTSTKPGEDTEAHAVAEHAADSRRKGKGKQLGTDDSFQNHDALLPGQLPDTPRDGSLRTKGAVGSGQLSASSSQHSNSGKRSHTQADLEPLSVPSYLRAGPSSFADDFCAGGTDAGAPTSRPASTGPAIPASSAGGQQAALAMLLNPLLLPAVSNLTGRHMMYKVVQLTHESAAAACGVSLAPGWPGASRAATAGAASPGGATPVSVEAAPGVSGGAAGTAGVCVGGGPGCAMGTAGGPASALQAVLHRNVHLARRMVQRELDMALELPQHPQLLVPYKVYSADDAAHIVYDGSGTELHTYLQQQQFLPESSCRSIMRQLLQALASLHAARWVHRNVSAEAVWVQEEPRDEDQEEGREQQLQQQHQAEVGTAPRDGEALDMVPCASESGTGDGGTSPPPRDRSSPSSSSCRAKHQSRPGRKASREPGEPAWEGPVAGDFPPRPPRAVQAGPGAGGDGRARQLVRLATKRRPPRMHARLGGLVHAVRLPRQAAPHQLPRELVGSAFHLAPEAIRGAGYGSPADVWAAGVLLCMLLTGRPPFRGRNELEVMTRVLLCGESRGDLAARPTSRLTLQPGPGPGPDADALDRPSDGDQPSGPDRRSGPLQPLTSKGGSRHGPQGQGQVQVVQELVVKVVLEAQASAECRQVLAGMLAVDPAKRMTAEELLQLPWFADGD